MTDDWLWQTRDRVLSNRSIWKDNGNGNWKKISMGEKVWFRFVELETCSCISEVASFWRYRLWRDDGHTNIILGVFSKWAILKHERMEGCSKIGG